MKTSVAFVGFLFSAAVGFAVGYAAGRGVTPPKGAAAGAREKASLREASLDETVYRVPVGAAPERGPSDALVTIVALSDFECPFCARAVGLIAELERLYGRDLRIVFKHFPLPIHPNATSAAEFSVAAQDQGKFWEFHDGIFSNPSALDRASLMQRASSLGLDTARVDSFLESGRARRHVDADRALGEKLGVTGTPTFFINGVKLSGVQPLANFQKVIDRELGKARGLVDAGMPRSEVYDAIMKNARDGTGTPAEGRPSASPMRQEVALAEHSPAKGAKDAFVTIVLWSDFECPFCSRVNPTLDRVIEEYKDKVQVQFRHQPLSFHKRALPAAKAAMAAHLQGKFWAYHDKLFQNQEALEDGDLERHARELGLNVARFKTDMSSPKVEALIRRDIEDGAKYGARGTPTLFVNGIPIRGAQPYASFKPILDNEVALGERLLAQGLKPKDVYAAILKSEAGKPVALPSPAEEVQRPALVPAGPLEIAIGNAPTRGSKNAAVKVVVYSDFECAFCSQLVPSLERVKEVYGDRVLLAFKHYPLPFHRSAEGAAVASLAAHKQGRFWEMHDRLFQHQDRLDREDLISHARALGLDVAKFMTDLEDPALRSWVRSDRTEGTKNGVSGTPATFVNGRKVDGAMPFEVFKALIDEELGKKS